MSTAALKKQAYAEAFVQTLAGDLELSPQLEAIFVRILSRQLDYDADADEIIRPNEGVFNNLAKAFTFQATPVAERPDGGPSDYDDLLVQADADAQEEQQEIEPEPEPGEIVFNAEWTNSEPAMEAVASKLSIEAEPFQLFDLKTLELKVGDTTVVVDEIDAEGEDDAEVIEKLEAALNDSDGFQENNLEASYSLANETLTITNEDGKAFSTEDVKLLNAGEQATASTAKIEILQGTLLNARALAFTIDGQDVAVEIEDDDAGTVAGVLASFTSEIQAKTIDDDTPFSDMEVTYDTGHLVITDDKGRAFVEGSVTLEDGGQPAEPSTMYVTGVSSADATSAARLTLDIAGYDGVQVKVDGATSLASLADQLNDGFDAWEADDGTTPLANLLVTAEASQSRLKIVDDLGRPGDDGRVFLESAAENVEPSQAIFTDITDGFARLQAGRFSAELGTEIEIDRALIDITTGGRTELATEIETVLNAADDDEGNITVTASADNRIVIEDALGREFSNVSILDIGEPKTDTEWYVNGITDADVADIDLFKIAVAGLNGGEPFEIEIDHAALTSNDGTGLAAFIDEKLGDEEVEHLSVTYEASDDRLVITDTLGRALSDIEALNTEGALPSTATISNLSDAIARLDVGRFSAMIGGVEVSLADVDVDDTTGDTTALASKIETVLQKALDNDITVSDKEGSGNNTEIVISDAKGRAILVDELSLATAGAASTTAETVALNGVQPFTEAAGTVQFFEADVEYVNDKHQLVTKQVRVNLTGEADMDAVETKLNEAFGTAFSDGLGASSGTDVVDASYDGSDILTITNKTGYSLSDVFLGAGDNLDAVATADASGAEVETATLTFEALTDGQSVTVAGLTLTASGAITAANVAAGFAGLAAGVEEGNSVTNGAWSGTLADWTTTGNTATGAELAFARTPASLSDPDNIPVSESGTPETATLTFEALTDGQSVTVAGLTLTASGAITAANVAAGFAGLAAGAEEGNSVTDGTWTGTLADWTTTGNTASSAELAFVSTTANENVDNIPVSESGTPETATLTFKELTDGQTVEVAGLTLTASGTISAADVAAGFAGLAAGAEEGNSVTNGAWSGTLADWTTTGNTASGADLAFVSTQVGDVSDLEPNAGTLETATLTFKELTDGQTVEVAGLTLTASGTISAADVAAGFAGLAAGAEEGNSVTNGAWSGTLADWTTTGNTASGADLAFVSTQVGDVSNLTPGGTGTPPTVVTVGGTDVVAATPTVVTVGGTDVIAATPTVNTVDGVAAPTAVTVVTAEFVAPPTPAEVEPTASQDAGSYTLVVEDDGSGGIKLVYEAEDGDKEFTQSGSQFTSNEVLESGQPLVLDNLENINGSQVTPKPGDTFTVIVATSGAVEVAVEAAEAPEAGTPYNESQTPVSGTPEGEGGDRIGAYDTEPGFEEDAPNRPEITVGTAVREQEGVIAGTGAEPLRDAEPQEGDPGEREQLNDGADFELGAQEGHDKQALGEPAQVSNGNPEGDDAQEIVPPEAITISQEGSEATDGSPWSASIELTIGSEALEEGENYEFTLTFTEDLEEPEEGAEPDVASFSVQREADFTATEVLSAFADEIADDPRFTAALIEEGQLDIIAVEETIDYTAVADYELIGVPEETGLDLVV
ncbi:hypothetical protein [Halochromatium salexigens]|uniref:Uncharacterized protein n=1 Tax=Halochromatium salexigens TaxID=49447 RepID=A0AAJ0UDD7_HALSE|nr:hypothetical protein [Halochromatium salexigens]MBK5929409.1 hypothetical protein [Halochromatium salexigens]